METNVVFAGVASENVAVVAAAEPVLVTTWVYVILLPATTGLGDAESVTVNSPPEVVPTTVEAEAVLLAELGSLAEELTAAVSVMIVPFAVPAVTLVTSEKVAAVPPLKLKSVQTMLPVPPAPGVTHVQPAGAVKDTNVLLAGMDSVSVALSAALGPLFVTTCE
jgi:hypothetical protein